MFTSLLGAFPKLCKVTISFVMAVCPSVHLSVRPSVFLSPWNNSAPTYRIFMKFDIWAVFEINCWENSNFNTIGQEQQTLYMKITKRFFIISHSILLTPRKVSNVVKENKKLCSATFSKIVPFFFEIMWEKCVERARPQMTIWRMRIACWITKATITHLQYVIFIAFPHQ